jgi:hypothetical protein
MVSKNWIKLLHALPVLRFNRCLTTKYNETTAHLNGNFNTDNQMYVPKPKCTATFPEALYMYVCMYMYIYVFMYVYMYIYIISRSVTQYAISCIIT